MLMLRFSMLKLRFSDVNVRKRGLLARKIFYLI